jgi:hypothetical protein
MTSILSVASPHSVSHTSIRLTDLCPITSHSSIRDELGMTSLGMTSPSGEVREALRASLGWGFSFASADPLAVRCLVAHPRDAARLAEWLVRALPPLSPAPRPVPAAERGLKQASDAASTDLETLLERELGFGRAAQLLGEAGQGTPQGPELDEVCELQQVRPTVGEHDKLLRYCDLRWQY